ncbi:hypothetical protein [Streptomyces griseorubiginosus]|uniref:hypothetical protein n=1 Tax=Streptomyces griseorubiginosus TaxID=67304 RepID=UPI0033263920
MNPDHFPQPGGQGPDDRFDQVMQGWNTPGAYQPAPAAPTASPYGTNPHIPAHSIPTKPGLTRRGRTALVIGSLVLAGGGLITWQHHADTAAAHELKAKELQLQQDQLDLKKAQQAAQANEQAQKAQAAADKARQAKVDACVQENKGLVGKQLGYRLSNVVEDCQTQYPATTGTGDMQEAATASSTNSNTAGTGLLIGGGVLVAGMVLAVKRATRPTPQPQPGPYGYYPPQ